MKQFKTGRTYSTNLACSSSTWLTYKVTRRTQKSVWLSKRHPGTGEFGEPKRRAIHTFGDEEAVFCDGRYSMAPVLRATD